MEEKFELQKKSEWLFFHDPTVVPAFPEEEGVVPLPFVDEAVQSGKIFALKGSYQGHWRLFVDQPGDPEIVAKAKKAGSDLLLNLPGGKLKIRGATQAQWYGKDWGRPPAYFWPRESEDTTFQVPAGTYKATVYEMDSEVVEMGGMLHERLGPSASRRLRIGALTIGALWLTYHYYEKVLRWKWPDYPSLPWYLELVLFIAFSILTFYLGKWIGYRAADKKADEILEELKGRYARVHLVLERIPEGSDLKGGRVALTLTPE